MPDGPDAMPDDADTGAPPGASGAPSAPGTPSPPGSPAAAGAPPPGLQGPTGPSPAMSDTGQQGMEMEARVAIGFLANRMVEMAGRLGLHSDLGKALHKAAGILSKAVPAGSVPPGAEQAQLQRILQQSRQNAANVASMRQQGVPAAGGGAPRPPTIPGGGGTGAQPGTMAA